MNVLDDKKPDGRSNDWEGKKNQSLKISNSLRKCNLDKRAARMFFCSNFLEFKQFDDGSPLKLHRANFCKDRLCPMCTWRRSLKQFGQTSKLMNYIQTKGEYDYIFLTLTIKNIEGMELSKSIKELTSGYSRLQRRKEFKNAILGSIRHLEVSFNNNPYSKSFKSFHPHLHCILMVRKSYFTSRDYIKQNKWLSMWQECVRVDYVPTLDVRKVNGNQNKAVCELSKYPVKMKSIIETTEDLTDYAVSFLAIHMISVRLVEYYGLFRKYRKELKLEDIENGDLVNTESEDDDLRNELKYVIIKYQWKCGLYIQVPEFNEFE